MHRLLPKPRSRFSALYEVVPDTVAHTHSIKLTSSQYVDVHFSNIGILIVGEWFHFPSPQLSTNIQQPLGMVFDNIHPSLQQTCGTIHLPPDNGESLIQQLWKNNNTIYGASDASLKNGKSSHAWIISSGNIDDISNPYNRIYGSGPVHDDLSSFRGELQGINAIMIIASILSEFSSQ